MGNIIVAILGALGYGNSLGKKGTSTDITLYDLKRGEDIVTFVEPTRYPERLAPLFFTVSMARRAILVINELNSTFGECVVMLQCCNITAGYLILRDYLEQEKVEAIMRGTVLDRFEFIRDDPITLSDRLLKDAQKKRLNETLGENQQPGIVPVDHAFKVKGVGTVILGVVGKGTIEKHELVKVLPGNKIAQIRSIQKHDDEFDQAIEGERIGLALKNVELEDLDRGTVLTADEKIKSSVLLKTNASLNKYWQTPVKPGMILHIGHWMQFISSRVEFTADNGDWRRPTLTLVLEKELIYLPGDQAVLTYLDGGKLRIVGTIELI